MVARIQRPRTRRDGVRVLVLFGPTGTGKSHLAFTQAGPDPYSKPVGGWWDGYAGEKVVVFDEFTDDQADARDFLRWTDKWPLRVQVKGGFQAAKWDRVVFTSNSDPRDWYQFEQDHAAAVQRRITDICEITARGVYVWHRGRAANWPDVNW